MYFLFFQFLLRLLKTELDFLLFLWWGLGELGQWEVALWEYNSMTGGINNIINNFVDILNSLVKLYI